MQGTVGLYEPYWDLARNPFENNADPAFFFRSHSHQAALLKMRYIIENRQGAGLLVGGIGYGKTYLIHRLAHELPEQFGPIVHLVFPQFTPSEFLAYLAAELGADNAVLNADSGLDRILRQIIEQLTRHTRDGRHPIIVVDECHLIENQRVFQTLQLLLNFQQQPRIDFTLLMVGEYALLSQVHRFAALDARIAVKSLLAPLSQEETAQYVVHRLKTAGTKRPIFDAAGLDALYELSGGVPRKINRLCDLALLVGFADRVTTISTAEIEAVAEELATVAPD